MAETKEFVCYCALFFAFWFTVNHPFLVASIIIAIIIYWISNSPDVQKTITDSATNAYKAATEHLRNATSNSDEKSEKNGWSSKKTSAKSLDQDEPMTRSGIERARRQYEEHCSGSSKEVQEENQISKLVLTYQVPILTTYYESIIKFFTQ